jgi:hypothetical protein
VGASAMVVRVCASDGSNGLNSTRNWEYASWLCIRTLN